MNFSTSHLHFLQRYDASEELEWAGSTANRSLGTCCSSAHARARAYTQTHTQINRKKLEIKTQIMTNRSIGLLICSLGNVFMEQLLRVCVYMCVCVVTRVLFYDLGQSVLFVQRTGGVHFTLHGFIQTQLLLKTTVCPETQPPGCQ